MSQTADIPLCGVIGFGVERFKQRLTGLQSSTSGYASVTQVEGLIREAAPSLSRHQAIAVLRQLPRDGAQQVSVEALCIALRL